jgi:hypothetical protein
LSAAADNVTFVPNRWTTEQVLALAPDAASQRTAARLAGQPRWSGAGAVGQVVWGLCAGSGQHPYQTVIDLSGPAYKCSCPSRKFPCKHALGLLLGWADGTVPETAEPAGFAASWIADRVSRASRPARTAAAGTGAADEKAAARRAQQRRSRVDAGLAELETWLRDQVRAGLSGTGGYRHAERVAARMVDAQAAGVAGVLRGTGGIAGSGDGWPGRLLAAYAGLHLLVRAHEQLESLPAGLAAVVRSHVGYPVARQDVLASPAVRDRWLVLGVRDVLDGTIPARRILLRGQQTARFALLLIFDPRGTFSGDLDAGLVPGTALTADLHFYPGQPTLRALIGIRHDEPGPAGPPEPDGDVGALLDGWAQAVAQDPWLASWPALLSGIPVPDGAGWQLADGSGQAVTLLTADSGAWPLVAISGGAPIVIAGEWTVDGLRPLTAWHGAQAVPLQWAPP